VSKGPHPEVKSKPCHVWTCKQVATKDYNCADCGRECCGTHMYWSWKTDKKHRCNSCFESHNKSKGVSYK
jgi:hypothetical protein